MSKVARIEYNSAPPGITPQGSSWPPAYAIQYRSSATGAIVYELPNWKETAKGKEKRITALLAENGYSVILQREENRGDYEKNPDTYLSDNGVWAIWEFKAVGEDFTSLRRSVQRKVHDAKAQAKNVVIYLPKRAFQNADYLDAVNAGIRLAFSHLQDAEYLDEMILLLDDSGMQRMTRERFFDERGISRL